VMKSIPQTEDLRTVILQNLEKAAIAVTAEERIACLNFVIAGGGPTGVEMAGALNEMKKHIFIKDYPELDLGQMTITLIEAADRLLSVMSDNASRKAQQFLEKSGVKVLLNVKLLDYDGNTVTLDKVSPIIAKTLIWTAGVKGTVPSGILKDSISRGNRIKVNSFNQMEGLQNVFAIGDVASLADEKNPNGLPMVAQVAIQEGKQLAENIYRSLNKKQMLPFSYKDKGSMAIISRNKAVADLHRFRFHGMFAWLIWTFVHLMSIVGFRNRLVVFVDWVWNYISYDRALRNIIRPYKEKQE